MRVQMEEMWKRIIAFEEYLGGVDKKIEEVLPVEADLPHLEHQQDLFSVSSTTSRPSCSRMRS